MIKYLLESEERLQQIHRDTEADESLQLLKAVIQRGWPEHKSNVPSIVNMKAIFQACTSFEQSFIHHFTGLFGTNTMTGS